MTLPDKLMLSLRLKSSRPIQLPDVVAIFHRWIASHALDEVLVDVADYSHVSGGPGVVLIGSDYTYSVAPYGQELELACLRKRKTPGQNPLLKTLRRLLEAYALLQEDFRECALEPSTASVRVSVFDRKATDHHPFRTAEFAWFVAEHLAAASGTRPQVSVSSGTTRPTVHAAWDTPTAVNNLLARGFSDSAAYGVPETRRNP